MKTAFLSAEYHEPHADTTWKGLKLSITTHLEKGGSKEKKIYFNTGDPIVDFYHYKKWMMNNIEKEKLAFINHSSSVDHFYMDSKKYVEKHILWNKDYSDGELVHWTEAQKRGFDVDKLIDCCVTEDMKTFQELKTYVKDKEKALKKKKTKKTVKKVVKKKTVKKVIKKVAVKKAPKKAIIRKRSKK
jgi:hypothetical protein